MITGELPNGTQFWLYDTAAELLVEVGIVRGSGVDARSLFDSLALVGIDDWTELAGPANLEPTKLR